MLKKITLLFFIVITLSCFCSCERYGTEIEDMMIIQGIAVDKDKEGYEVTIEMLNNKQSASADSSNVGDEMTLCYSGKGETVAEALRLIKEMPKWKPGKQRGKEVNVKYTLPIHFRLQ